MCCHRCSVMAILSITLLVAFAVGTSSLRAQEEGAEASGRLSANDTLRIHNVGGPRISPDGEWILYTVSTRDMDGLASTARATAS